jgi:hypothetical protein
MRRTRRARGLQNEDCDHRAYRTFTSHEMVCNTHFLCVYQVAQFRELVTAAGNTVMVFDLPHLDGQSGAPR